GRMQAGAANPGAYLRGRNPGEPALRGGGGNSGNSGGPGDREHVLGGYEDFNCSSRGLAVDGPEGSGEQLVGGPRAAGGPSAAAMPLAYRLGDMVSNLFRRKQPEIRAQSTASYLDHSADGSRRHASLISPRARGMSRIEDEHVQVDVREGDDAESMIRSLRHEPSLFDEEEATAARPRRRRGGFMQWFFGRGPGEPAREQAKANETELLAMSSAAAGLPEAGILNEALRRRPAQARADDPEPAELDPAREARAESSPGSTAAGSTPKSAQKTGSSSSPPMFPPFSHLPVRAVEQLMHRAGEPRVFVGSARSQLVAPSSQVFDDASPYRSGTEWDFLSSVQFSSPYPTSTRAVKNRALWGKQRRRLLLKRRSNEIARWPAHLELLRDLMQLLALVLGTCGFTKAPLDSSVGDRWPWMLVAGVPETLGLLWADLSTVTGQSIGFFGFFGALAALALGVWTYGLYLERPGSPARRDKRGSKDADDGEKSGETQGLITYEAELAEEPGAFDIIGRMFRHITRRQRMHAAYVVLSTLYVPVVKLCLEAIVWGQGYWPVANPYRTEDHPEFGAAAAGMREPSRFCYTTTMRTGAFNGAYVVLPLAVVVFLALGVVVPLQVHQLAERHKPRVPGWADGKVPGFKLPPKDSVSAANLTGSGPLGPNDASAAGEQASVPREAQTRNVQSRDADGTRDDPNPMLYAEPIWQGIQQMNLVNPEMLGYLAAIYGMMYGNNNGDGQNGHQHLTGLLSGAWKHIQQWWTKEAEEDPYLGMEKDEAYQARLRDMKHSHRNRHLATVQYRRALDTDASDFRFLYVGQYPAHAGDPARMLLWKLVAVVAAVVLAKDNCWARAHARQAMDAARCAVLLLLALLLLRSLHAHRPFFDPTANLAALIGRVAVVGAALFAFPLFLLADPLSQAHMGLCVTLAVLLLLAVLALLWLLAGALPGVRVAAVPGASPALTLSPGVLVATSAYDARLRRLLIERVWQDTWSALLLASRDFRLLPNHRVAFCRGGAHPPYMVNYIGFAAERHLENLHLYDAIGRRTYCQAILLERNSDQRTGLMDEIVRVHTGPDMYFNPFADGAESSARLRLAPGEVRSWFGCVHVLHFPFMACIEYDELPGVVVPIAEEADLQLYLQQNQDPAVQARRSVRRRLRALHGQQVTLTYVEQAGGALQRYCLPPYADENDAYLAQLAGRRRVLLRGELVVRQRQQQQQLSAAGVSVMPGFDCALVLRDELIVHDEHLVNNLDRANNAFRAEFWRTGHAPGHARTGPTQRTRDALRVDAHNRHLLGVSDAFDETPELRALFDENSDVLDQRLPRVEEALRAHADECHAAFLRKRTGLTPSFHIDVFAPGPESYHVQALAASGQPPPEAATPALFGAPALNGQWHNDEHGRLSYIPTMEQLAERLERLEENRYMRALLVDHRDDIVLLYERLRTLVPSAANDPVKFAWYIFWDDLYRRYAQHVPQFKAHDCDFNPLYAQSLPYYPLPRHRLERFLYARGLFTPGRRAKPGLLAAWFGRRRQQQQQPGEAFAMDPMPVPQYVPGLGDHGAALGDARLWRAGEANMIDDDSSAPFEPGCAAGGFVHSGLLNRLYSWLDIIAYGTER
ncbi:hypothetical protein H4S02_001305, partial [Coemansia sp. RSA 2611]